MLGTLLVAAVVLGMIARRENLRAELNLGLARAAVDESLTSAERDPASLGADMPEMEQFRQELLEKARRFYAAFMDQDPRSEISRRDLVEAQYRLGHIDRLMRKPEDAQKRYRTAVEGFQKLSDDYPEQPATDRALPTCTTGWAKYFVLSPCKRQRHNARTTMRYRCSRRWCSSILEPSFIGVSLPARCITAVFSAGARRRGAACGLGFPRIHFSARAAGGR